MYKTTKKDFAEFKKECEYWIEYFGLKQWQFEYRTEKLTDARAEVRYGLDGMIADVYLAEEWKDPPQKNAIKRDAFHEICETMFIPLEHLAKQYFNKYEVDEKVHAIIRTFENTIFKEKRG